MDLASSFTLSAMATRSVSVGLFGDVVRGNLSMRRAELGLTAQEVADRTSTAPRPLGRSAVSELERGARRVDVDDLVALAVALETSPSDLLTPAATGTEIDLGQNNITLLTGQIRRWLVEGGDVRAVAHPDDRLEAELAAINTELRKLDKVSVDRNVLISVLYDKIEQADNAGHDLDQLQTVIREETRQAQKDRRRRDTLELRRLQLQSTLKKGSD